LPEAQRFFEAPIETQEHDANQPAPNQIDEKDTWSTLQTICDHAPLFRLAFTRLRTPKIAVRRRQLVKLG
jgi:hypothetical protein